MKTQSLAHTTQTRITGPEIRRRCGPVAAVARRKNGNTARDAAVGIHYVDLGAFWEVGRGDVSERVRVGLRPQVAAERFASVRVRAELRHPGRSGRD